MKTRVEIAMSFKSAGIKTIDLYQAQENDFLTIHTMGRPAYSE